MLFLRKNRLKKTGQTEKTWNIKKPCLELILECAKSTYPNEFGGLLRVDDEVKDTITEVVILPGTISGDSHAIFQMHMRPIDFSIVGTVHSHPSPSYHPSDADLHLFQKYGKVHIIAAHPFTESSWEAYNYRGNKLEMKII